MTKQDLIDKVESMLQQLRDGTFLFKFDENFDEQFGARGRAAAKFELEVSLQWFLREINSLECE
jgi:hypothetical protein